MKRHIIISAFREMRASLVAQTVKNLPVRQETWVPSLVGKIPGEGHGNPLQYSCLENSLDGGD